MTEAHPVQLAVLPGLGSSVSAQQTAVARVTDMCPALYRAVRNGRIRGAMALLLQQHGAAAPSDNQATGIMRQHGRCDVLELSAEGNTVLHVAAEHGHSELIQELYLRFRERIEGLLVLRNSALDTPLHCAARSGSGKAVQILLQLASVALVHKNEAGDTALHLAANHGHYKVVKVLVAAAPAAAAELNNGGVSPLYLAVVSGSVQAVRAITSTCRDASASGPSAQNALHAAIFQSSQMVQLLLEWRPGMADEVDCNGSTPLHFASSDGDLSVVRAILRGAPPRTVYRKDHTAGLSALHVAARMGHHKVVEEMLKSSPDAAELRDDGGGTFLHAAAKEKRYSVLRLVLKKNRCAFRKPVLRSLLNAQDRVGNTLLHVAVAAGAPDVVENLLRNGKVRADVLNNAGHTAFDLVAESTNYFCMVSLVVTLVAYKGQPRPQRQDHVKPWNSTGIVRGIEKTSDSLTVVAVLIATAAFAAGFNLPGGYAVDGTPNLKFEHTFKYFLVLDTIAVVTSVAAAILLVNGRASYSTGSLKGFLLSLRLMWLSLISLMLAFYMAMFVLATKKSSDKHTSNTSTILNICIQLLSLWLLPADITSKNSIYTELSFLWQSCCRKKGRHVIKRQYPLASASIPKLFLFINHIVSFCFLCYLITELQ